MKPLKVVCIGGGTGLSTLLRGIRQYVAKNGEGCETFDMDALTAIVSVSDDGGSSGRLIDEFGVLPPGDIRNCLVALAAEGDMMSRLFEHRFDSAGTLQGHSVGNLLLIALTHMFGSFPRAIQEASRVLAVRGRILPVTLEPTTLCAELANGVVICGESAIPRRGDHSPIHKVFLTRRSENGNGVKEHPPGDDAPHPDLSRPIPALPDAAQAIWEADAVIIGPGSLFTSILPNLAVPEIADSLKRSSAVKIYVCNVMAEPGETDGFSVTDHVQAIFRHVDLRLDYVLVNSTKASPDLVMQYLRAEMLETYQRLHGHVQDAIQILAQNQKTLPSLEAQFGQLQTLVHELTRVGDPSRVQILSRPGEDEVSPAQLVEDDLMCEQEIRERNAALRVIRHDPPKLAAAIAKQLRRHYEATEAL